MTLDEPFKGLRLLLAEDETMVAMMLQDILSDLGCEVLGPAGSVAHAQRLAQSEPDITVAVLDVDLGGVPIYPVAETLRARGVPFVFITGYGAADLDRRFTDAPAVLKPFSMAALRDALLKALD